VGIDVISGGRACDGMVRLFSGKYPQNRELVCDSGEQTMTVRGDLERYWSDERTTRGNVCGRCAIRGLEVCMSCRCFLLLPLTPFLSGNLPQGRREDDVGQTLRLSVPNRCRCRPCLSKLEKTCKPVFLKTSFYCLFSVSGAPFFPGAVRVGYH
jgi:hypothetical protein